MTDIAFKQFEDGLFDVDIVDGDLQADNGMRTSVLISLFTDRIAEADDVMPDGTNNRRGYWADAYVDGNDKTGSRLWLLSNAKQTTETLQRAEEYANESLQHFVNDGVASNITSEASWFGDGILCLTTGIFDGDNALYQGVFNFSLEQL